MTAYGTACACGWVAGPVGNPHRKGGLSDRLAEVWIDLRRWVHGWRCPL